MCGDTNLTVGKQGMSYLAIRLVPDEAVAASVAPRTVPKVTYGCPCKACRVCGMVLFPSWVVIDSSRHLSWTVRNRLGSRHCSFLKC